MKRILLTILLLALNWSVKAQVILLDADDTPRLAVQDETPFIPVLGVTYDQYVPITDGVLLLCGLGGTYLLKKKRKRDL